MPERTARADETMLSPKIRQTRRARSKSMVMGDVSGGGLRVCSPCGHEGALKAGWLRKQRSIMKNWQLRWFVLRADLLYFYKDQEETKPQGCVRLHGCQVREQTSNHEEGGRHLFEILPGGGDKERSSVGSESLLLMAASQAEMEEWVKALQRAIWGPLGGGVFGRRLEETMECERGQGVCVRLVPLLVEQCVCFIRERGLNEEGLFRMPGQANLVKELQDAFDHGDKPQFDSNTDVHTVASLLKLYLRELPEPVIPFTKYQDFISCAQLLLKDQEAGLLELGNQVKTLPQANYNLLKYICKFLDEVQSYSDDNKMGVQNLATVFGPNILRSTTDDPVRMMEGTSQVQQLMTVLISAHTQLFDGAGVCEEREVCAEQAGTPQRCVVEWESHTHTPHTPAHTPEAQTSHTPTNTHPPEPPRAESPSRQRPLSGWRCSFRGAKMGGSAVDVSSSSSSGGGGGGGSWLMNGLSSLRNHRRTSSGERVREPSAHAGHTHRLSTYDNVSLPSSSLSVPSVATGWSSASSSEIALPDAATGGAREPSVSPSTAAAQPGAQDESVCVSGRATPEAVCVSGRATPDPVCVTGQATPEPVCVSGRATPDAVCVSGEASEVCVSSDVCNGNTEEAESKAKAGNQSEQSEGALVMELKSELKKQKISYEKRIRTLEECNASLRSRVERLEAELDQEQKRLRMLEIKLRNSERAQKDADKRNHMLQTEMEEFFSTLGDLTH
ncbi:rho GTPase-activating protein 22 [Sardina pilchardus]|uniref:rho GTPase-activating protein 22 n=1 Tax=Sardina pilchardus TaxID=27697 RepID=UPI002E122F18